MKKATKKKLVLSKETVRKLTVNDMRQVAGGTEYTVDFCGPSVRVVCKYPPTR